MNTIVPRTCTVIPLGDENQKPDKVSQPLSAFREAPAFVLLGDPGLGKTTAFESECNAHGEEACMIAARDFLALDPDQHPEWRNKTLFIDGLDEVRAGAAEVRTPFDRIRNRLEELGRPRFRLSCREADWLGETDWQHLTTVSKDHTVVILRLDPLTEADIAHVLENHGIDDTRAFMENACDRRIDGLLTNPLTLELLATVITHGEQWPDSRLQTLEQACSYLVREHNAEHKVAGQRLRTNHLLDAAGRLCAVQLISGKDGYTQDDGDSDSDFPALEGIEFLNPDALHSVLSTKLFKAESGSLNRFGPIHRHIAEYLGARYLAREIECGLPVRRVLSLITGEDGIVVTGMRGLSAWLAAHCKCARSELIERDPVGVGLYGDIRAFSLEEKEALLKALNREASRLGSTEMAPAFGPLATPDMERALTGVLSNSSRESQHQTFVDFVLRLLREGSPNPGLSDLLLDIVRDETRWPGINVLALDAFVRHEDEEPKIGALKSLLEDIEAGRVSDPEDDLLGILLWRLFPEELPASEIWNYAAMGNYEGSSLGYYYTFWETGLTQKSSPAQIAELLDKLCERRSLGDWDRRNGLRIEHFPPMLLAKGLENHGDQLDVERLYDWLDAFRWAHHYVDHDVGEIRSWLEQRPDIQKKLTLEGLKRHRESVDLRYGAVEIQERIFDASPPADFGVWCLKQALAMASRKPTVAEPLLELAWRCHSEQRGHKGLSLKLLEKYTGKSELLKSRLDVLRGLNPTTRGDRVEDRDRYGEWYIDQRRRLEEEWLDHLRANEAMLRENRAAPAFLTEIAARYFSNSITYSSGSGPRELEQDLGQDKNLIDAVRAGIRGVVEREDVPGVEEILALKSDGQVYHIGWPFLAALEEIEQSAPEEFSELNEDRMRRALAFHYSSDSSNEPNWYRRIRDARPDIVAEMLVRYGVPELRSGNGAVSGLFALPRSKELAQVANLASLPLLRGFPTRCKNTQIEALNNLLWAALRYADRASLNELIDRKLAAKSMNVAQRVRWLGAAIVLSPGMHIDTMKEFVQERERRVRNLAGFFPSVFPRAGFSLSDVELQIPALEVLIRLIGSYFRPYEPRHVREDEWNASLDTDSELVHAFIQRLAASRDKDASDALNRLVGDPAISAWQDVLSRAIDFQRVIHRDANYRHPEVQDVYRTLDGGSPANAADLSALLVDKLDEVATQIKGSNTDDWRQYWNEDSHGRTIGPKAENSCRDALLSDLRLRLPGELDAQPEGQYARDKRADIRVSSGQDYQVPIEIKKNSHPNLWTAIENQLIAKYTRDPGAAGHGIYLVFWFGSEHTTFPPSGSRPHTPDELREQLQASLSDVEARRISVVVIDVSGEELNSGQV